MSGIGFPNRMILYYHNFEGKGLIITFFRDASNQIVESGIEEEVDPFEG